MSRALWLLIALLISGCGLLAPQKRAERRQAEAARKAQAERPPTLLWKVQGDAGTIYLFGTMHFGVSPDELPSVVAETLATCDIFVLESDPTAADQRRLADMMVLPRGTPGLDERLGAQRWKTLLEMLDGAFEERVAKRLQPWVLEAKLIGDLMPTQTPMETGLIGTARANTIPIEYLETWDSQIEMLNRISSLDALMELIDDPQGFRERTLQMSADYLRGDIAALETHIFGPEYASEDALFEDRNRAWLPRLDELARGQRVFVAVGAGHLLGPDSVLKMLGERGYKLERIR